jgi:hypothetical protein
MDKIRSKLLFMLIERGLIKRFREIPIAIAGKGVDSYVDSEPVDTEGL